RRRDPRIADLRIEARGAQIHVVIQRQLDRIVYGEAHWYAGRLRRRARGEAERENQDRRRSSHGSTRWENRTRNERLIRPGGFRRSPPEREQSQLRRIVEQRVRDGRDDERQQQRQRLAA